MHSDPIKILDYGYVRFIEAWGRGEDKSNADDFERGIVEAARQSTQGNFRGWDKDARLLAHLYNNDPKHATPFEFAGMVIEVQAPIMVFREWHRHRTQGYNEMSARYAPLPPLDYLPELGVLLTRSDEALLSSNKQAQGMGRKLDAETATKWLEALQKYYDTGRLLYQAGLDIGVPKELARLAVTVGGYSRMRAQTVLRNWLAFLTLRMDPKAQWEIRQFANALYEIICQVFPHTAKLFTDEFTARQMRSK